MRNQHVWTEKTEDGEKREVRATMFGDRWKIQSKLHGRAAWTYHDRPLLADLETLRELLFRKYQRRRVAYDDLQGVDRLLALARHQAAPSPAPAPPAEPAT